MFSAFYCGVLSAYLVCDYWLVTENGYEVCVMKMAIKLDNNSLQFIKCSKHAATFTLLTFNALVNMTKARMPNKIIKYEAKMPELK